MPHYNDVEFSWIIKNKLAASSIPEGIEDLKRISRMGIKALLCLTEEHEIPFGSIEEYRSILNSLGIEFKHVPVKDYHAPSLDALIDCVKWIDDKIKEDKSVLVHCHGGLGRTGTVIASYLIYSNGFDAEEAIEYLRRIRPGSVSTFQQEIAVFLFKEYLKNSISVDKP